MTLSGNTELWKDVHNASLCGRLPLFIEGFLKDRQFQVRLSAYQSQLYDQEMEVPQGSILSVTLFGLNKFSIVKSMYLLVLNVRSVWTISLSAIGLNISVA